MASDSQALVLETWCKCEQIQVFNEVVRVTYYAGLHEGQAHVVTCCRDDGINVVDNATIVEFNIRRSCINS